MTSIPDKDSPAGFYEDPVYPGYVRWWDGENWAETIRKANSPLSETILISDLPPEDLLAMSQARLAEVEEGKEKENAEEMFLLTLASMNPDVTEPSPWLMRLPFIAAGVGFLFALLTAWFFAAMNTKPIVVLVAFLITSIPSIVILLRARDIQQRIMNSGL